MKEISSENFPLELSKSLFTIQKKYHLLIILKGETNV